MRRREERGVVVVQAVAVATIVAMVALLCVQVAGLVRLRHQVAGAADFAALAASRASVAGEDGCAAARKVARRNGATMVACRMDYDVATVTVRGESRRWWGHRWTTRQVARALPEFYLDP